MATPPPHFCISPPFLDLSPPPPLSSKKICTPQWLNFWKVLPLLLPPSHFNKGVVSTMTAGKSLISRLKKHLIFRLKNYMQIDELQIEEIFDLQMEELYVDRRTINSLKNYLQIEELSTTRTSIWSADRRIVCRLRNYLQMKELSAD